MFSVNGYVTGAQIVGQITQNNFQSHNKLALFLAKSVKRPLGSAGTDVSVS
jgi:hypothetical protein